VVTIVIAAAVTWMARGIYPALGVMGVYAGAQMLESFWLTPRIMGRHLSISPWWVFLAVFVAGLMFGFLGLLLVVPAMVVALVVWRFVRVRPTDSPGPR
jgi:predicted PurR-regulated permease PerM